MKARLVHKSRQQLQESLPFKEIDTDLTNKKALKELEKNEFALVIHIPENFSEDAQSGKGTNIDFTVNEASATMVSSAMSSVVTEINKQLSTSFSQQTAQGILMQFNVPEEQAKELATQIENSYTGNYVVMNDVPDGMHNNMLPMFITMASYVGAMIAAMQLVGSFKANRGKASKTRLFIIRTTYSVNNCHTFNGRNVNHLIFYYRHRFGYIIASCRSTNSRIHGCI